MTFEEVLAHVIEVLQREGRVSYRALRRRFDLDEEYLEDLKAEIIDAKKLAVDEEGRVLVWSAAPAAAPAAAGDQGRVSVPSERGAPEAERRQITVMFCDLVDSTELSGQLDPEELREVVRAYQETCAAVIERFEGHIAQYLGDGLLVYFGYPLAHEDDAQRSVRAGLGIVEAIAQLNTRLERERGIRLAIRLGSHTGLVVVGEMGRGAQSEQLAVGETPNIAARLQGLAEPNTLVVSAATYRLIHGFFACQALGAKPLRGLSQGLEVYRVTHESAARGRLDAAVGTGLTPLVGREQEVRLLLERWEQVKEGVGQVVLLSAEAGVGKSRLAQVLKEHVARDPQAWLTPCQCSPYYHNTAFHPIIDLLERVVLQFAKDDSPPQKLSKIEGWLVQYGLALPNTVPLIAALLSVPIGERYPALYLTPERQKQKTMEAFLQILLGRAAQQPVLFVVEDLHLADPSNLELLTRLVDQGPTVRILTLLTFRQEFSPAWLGRAHLTRITLDRLSRRQVVDMIRRIARGKTLPPEVIEQIVAKTDGVPLFVEEVTKMVLESGLLQERAERYELTGPLPALAIPATLHDSLMARLDRLATVKMVAQLGAVLGREFTYELLQAVSPLDEGTLQRELARLVEAELLYQRGIPPRTTYLFKHALIQEEAYQSLLKSTRQQYHQRIAQVLTERFAETTETHPELLAHHYTEAGLQALAIGYWQRAGQRAMERSANVEAINHLTKGLELLRTLPDTPERAQQELTLQVTLGFTVPEVEQVYARASELCRQVAESPQLFPVLLGLLRFYLIRGELHTARELGERLYTLAEHVQDPALLLEAHRALGGTLFWLGELPLALAHLEQTLARYDSQQHRSHAFMYGVDPMVFCLFYVAIALWLLGYPVQALQRGSEGLALAYELSHPYSLGFALNLAGILYQFRREWQAAQERAEAAIALSTEQEFPVWLQWGVSLRSWALAAGGQAEAGMAQIRRDQATSQTAGVGIAPYHLALMGEVYGKAGRAEEGLACLAEALDVVRTTGVHFWESELYRLKGELLLALSAANQPEAEACFRQSLDVAYSQSAKSLELRTAISLSRLWHQQDKHAAARQLLTEIYSGFTEGFETADLQEAKALLEAMA